MCYVPHRGRDGLLLLLPGVLRSMLRLAEQLGHHHGGEKAQKKQLLCDRRQLFA
jgi:hypothetical protein